MVVKKIQGYIQHLISLKLGNHPFGLLANWVQTRGSSSARYPRSDCRKMPQTQLLSSNIPIFLMYIGSSVIVLFRQIQLISVLSEIYSVLWSVGRTSQIFLYFYSLCIRSHSSIISSSLRYILSARNVLSLSCIIDMRFKVCQRFFRRSSIVIRPILSGEYTCSVSQGISAFSAKHDKLFAIRSSCAWNEGQCFAHTLSYHFQEILSVIDVRI